LSKFSYFILFEFIIFIDFGQLFEELFE